MSGDKKITAIKRFVVPETGIEPVRSYLGSTDFKSVVSTNSTTRAGLWFVSLDDWRRGRGF